MGMEFGRPGIATRLGELEKMTVALAGEGVRFEPKNPVFALLADPSSGRMRDDVKNERVLSAIVEVEFEAAELPRMIEVVKGVARTLDTVFSWCLFTRVDDDGSIPVLPVLRDLGIAVRPNAKVNMGLGRPLVND